MVMALEAGMPSAVRMFSACSLRSGSIRAYRFADFAISKTPFGLMVFIFASIIHECADNGNTIRDYFCKFSLNSNAVRDNIVNVVFVSRNSLPVILLVALPQIQQKSKRHQPHLILAEMKMGKAVIKKPGKQLRIGDRYPTCAFFESFSLSTFRLVPL
nr:MAG TPA: hypothetical protein [Caudoviricetes sp.]